jgi:hypothetical protein
MVSPVPPRCAKPSSTVASISLPGLVVSYPMTYVRTPRSVSASIAALLMSMSGCVVSMPLPAGHVGWPSVTSKTNLARACSSGLV